MDPADLARILHTMRDALKQAQDVVVRLEPAVRQQGEQLAAIKTDLDQINKLGRRIDTVLHGGHDAAQPGLRTLVLDNQRAVRQAVEELAAARRFVWRVVAYAVGSGAASGAAITALLKALG